MSHTLCAQVFVSGLDPARVYADTIENAARFGVSHGPRGDVDGVSRLVAAVVAAVGGRPR